MTAGKPSIKPIAIQLIDAAERLDVTVDHLVGLIQRGLVPGLIFGKRERKGVIGISIVEALESGELDLHPDVPTPTNRELAERALKQEMQLSGRPDMRPAVLYRAFDAAERLLYVGISLRAPERMYQHQRDKPWWTDVAYVTFEHYPNIKSAERAETVAIVSEDPYYNVAKTGRKPESKADRRFFSFVGRWNAYKANALRESQLRLNGDMYGAAIAKQMNVIVIEAQREHLASRRP